MKPAIQLLIKMSHLLSKASFHFIAKAILASWVMQRNPAFSFSTIGMSINKLIIMRY